MRSSVEVVPSRSDFWTTLVQKQVGQTSVQLVQPRQRSATAAQPGCSGFSARPAWAFDMSSGVPIARRAPATTSAAASSADGSATGRSSESMSADPAGEPVRTTYPSSSSVSATSKPEVASGPVPIEVQKQVEVGVAHSTATTKVAARRAR